MAANRLKLNAEKTELLWAGLRFSPEAQLDSKGPSVQFGTEAVSPSDHVRVLGVTFRLTSLWTSTLPVFAHWAFIGCANYDVSDDPNSTKTLVHAFTASRVDYCNAILAGSPRSMTDKLQHLQCCSTSRHTMS